MADKKRAESLPLEFKLVSADEVPLTYAIEIQEYPEDEAASLENLIFRQNTAPELFLGCYLRNDDNQNSPTSILPNSNSTNTSLELVGYIVSTLASGDHLTHSSMSSHDPSGDAVCIHSVCVSSAFQRRGIATRLVREYLQQLQGLNNNAQSSKKLKRVLLIAHEHTIRLYAGVGFVLVGKSSVEHGPDPWFEMVYTFEQ